jgi:hypothetical protein
MIKSRRRDLEDKVLFLAGVGPQLGAELDKCPETGALMELACRRTGLSDFGDPARGIGLERFVFSLRREAWGAMTLPARERVVGYLIHLLGNRLKLVADRKQYPQIAQQKIIRPMIVVGPPRSGSTLLHKLLSLDPDHLAPEHAVCMEPSPPLARGAMSSERTKLAEGRMMALFEPIPDIFVTHPYMIEEGAGALAECGSDILNMVFTCQQLWCFYRGESYRQYLLEGDHTAALDFHHDFLQHLQWGTDRKRWALKGSDHMLWLRELAAQYPDAMLIWTHRDLAQQLGSLASIQTILCGLTGKPASGEEREAVGRLAIEQQRASFLKGIRAREQIGEDRFFDVSYHDMMANPVEVVGGIYQRFGLQMKPEHAGAIRDWLANNPQTKHGVHKYSSDEFGLEETAINRQFKDYVDRFGFGFGIRGPSAGQQA